MLEIDSEIAPINSCITPELAIAPRHPLNANLELPLPNIHQASIAEIRKVQLRDQIPGLVKRLIGFEAETFWEYWWIVPGRLLLPEDVELLNRDRSRIETILNHLIWLFGGYCFEENTQRQGNQTPVYDWQQVQAFAHQQGFESYILDIDYLPTAIKPYQLLGSSNPDYVAVEPTHWHIEFFQLQPTVGGFELREPKKLCSCQIWTGQPFLKHRNTGEVVTQYDLWVAKPLDITNPPWRVVPEL